MRRPAPRLAPSFAAQLLAAPLLALASFASAQDRPRTRSLAEFLAELPATRGEARVVALRTFADSASGLAVVPDLLVELRSRAPGFDASGCEVLREVLESHAGAAVPVAEVREVLLEVVARPRWESRYWGALAFEVLLQRPEALRGHEERIARVLVPLLASQRWDTRGAAAAALEAMTGTPFALDPFLARTWFHETFGGSVDLHTARFEFVLAMVMEEAAFIPQHSGLRILKGGEVRYAEEQLRVARRRGATFELVLQPPHGGPWHTDDLAEAIESQERARQLVDLLGHVTLAPGDRVYGNQFLEPSESHVEAQGRIAARIGELVGTRVPGAQVAVVLPDGALLEFAHGVSDRASKTPMGTDVRMLAGSIGKTFFSALALQLAQEGRIGLDDPVAKWLGNAPWWKRLPNGERMTLRHLLQHRSGLPRYEFDEDFTAQLTSRPDHLFTPEEELAFVFDAKPSFLPGEGFEYADTNYVLLAMALEKVLHAPCYDAIAQRFLGPLALGGTIPSVGRRIEGLGQGHAGEPNPFGGRDAMLVDGELPFDPGFEGAGGGFASTAGDLARWAQALYLGPLLGAARKELLDGQPAPLGRDAKYGCGSILQPTRLGLAVGHRGFFPGWLGEMRSFPEHGVSVAILVNSSADLRVAREMPGWAVAFAEAALGK